MLLTALIVVVGFVILSTIVEQSEKAALTAADQKQDVEANQPLVSTISKVLDENDVVPSRTAQPSPTWFYATSVPSTLKMKIMLTARTMQPKTTTPTPEV